MRTTIAIYEVIFMSRTAWDGAGVRVFWVSVRVSDEKPAKRHPAVASGESRPGVSPGSIDLRRIGARRALALWAGIAGRGGSDRERGGAVSPTCGLADDIPRALCGSAPAAHPRQPLEALRDEEQVSADGLVVHGIGEPPTFLRQFVQALGRRWHPATPPTKSETTADPIPRAFPSQPGACVIKRGLGARPAPSSPASEALPNDDSDLRRRTRSGIFGYRGLEGPNAAPTASSGSGSGLGEPIAWRWDSIERWLFGEGTTPRRWWRSSCRWYSDCCRAR